MDRIDKFLNRRKQKTKRVVKTNNKYYEITKEDIKVVRKYKKNACLDPTVDMYIPYKLTFSKDTQNTPLEFVKKGSSVLNEEKMVKKFLRKNDYTKIAPEPKNVISDIWVDDLKDYHQNIVLDVNDQYTGKLVDLRMKKEDLEKELRRTYLKQYLPRERKTLKISDLLKNNIVKEDLYFPHTVAKYYKIQDKCVIDRNGKYFACYTNNLLEIFEIKNFYRIFTHELDGIIEKVELESSIRVLCTLENGISKIYEVDIRDKSVKILHESSNVFDFSCDKYNLYVTSRSINFFNTQVQVPIKKLDKLTKIFTNNDLLFVITSNSLKVYDITRKLLINESTIFSFIIDFVVHKNLIFLINNLKKIFIFDYERNVVIHTMVQDNNLYKISYNDVHSLLAVSTENEILIFYVNIGENQYSFVNRIQGTCKNIYFDCRMPWLYVHKNNKIFLYT